MDFDISSIVGDFAMYEPVGSRVTCDPAPQDTDEDYLVLDSMIDSIPAKLEAAGFTVEGESEFYTGNDAGGFVSYRKGNVNVICTSDGDFYQNFLTATALAKRFNLLRKADRIALFQAVLYRVSPNNLEGAE